jgi:hypothetical protein
MEKAFGCNIYHTTGRKSSQKSPFSAILEEILPLQDLQAAKGRKIH